MVVEKRFSAGSTIEIRGIAGDSLGGCMGRFASSHVRCKRPGKFTEEGGFGISMKSDDVKSCIDAMSKLAGADNRKKGTWSRAGKALAKDFLWPVVADEIELVYKRVVGLNSLG